MISLPTVLFPFRLSFNSIAVLTRICYGVDHPLRPGQRGAALPLLVYMGEGMLLSHHAKTPNTLLDNTAVVLPQVGKIQNKNMVLPSLSFMLNASCPFSNRTWIHLAFMVNPLKPGWHGNLTPCSTRQDDVGARIWKGNSLCLVLPGILRSSGPRRVLGIVTHWVGLNPCELSLSEEEGTSHGFCGGEMECSRHSVGTHLAAPLWRTLTLLFCCF